MAYMTIPNSFTTANTVLADALQENYEAITTNIMCGTVDINVAKATLGNVTVSGSVSATNFSISGTDKGTRHLIPLAYFNNMQVDDPVPAGYIPLMNGTDGLGNVQISLARESMRLPKTGSVTGYSFFYDEGVASQGTFVAAIEVSGTTLASHEFYNNAALGTQTAYSVITRGVVTFDPLAPVAIRWNETTSAPSSYASLGVLLEVVYDG